MRVATVLLAATALLPPARAGAQGRDAGNDRFPGSAVVTIDDAEYLIRIECRVRGRPEAGLSTEPNRITREATGGRYNMLSLHLRPWQDTGDVLVSVDRYVAWIPSPTSEGGVLSLELAMSPASVVRQGVPVAVTYDMWKGGDRPAGLDGVRIVANCNARDPEAPAFRRIEG